MTHGVSLSPEAKQDVLEIEQYLIKAGPDVVQAFPRVLARALRRIRDWPSLFPVVWREVRRAQTRPFKYGVFFTINGDACRVVGVIDLRRDPQTWRHRR